MYYRGSTLWLVGICVAIVMAFAFGVILHFGFSEQTTQSENAVTTDTVTTNEPKEYEFVLVDATTDTAEVGRYHHYTTILKFYLQEKTSKHIFAFIVPKEVYGAFQCGDTVIVNVQTQYMMLFDYYYNDYYINNHSVSYEYRLQPDEETPVKHISEQAGKGAVQTSESGEQE